MAKNKVINTILQLRDNMSGGLLQAARNAKKAGIQIDDSMMKSTRKVVAFKNKFKSSLTEMTKKAAAFGTATAAGLAGGFLALDSVTEEYRRSQGRLNTAFDAAKLSAKDAKLAYEGFYRILGDTDTATEASQLLAKLTQNGKDVYTWLHIAAGVSGTFGDSLPIESLIEAMNETAKVGKVTGTFADALNWANVSEDKFNERLEGCSTEAERNALIMDTMLGLYNDAAHAFYENNDAMMKSRSIQTRLSSTMAGLGDASLIVKNGLLEMAGAQEEGGFRAGSMLDWASGKAQEFTSWVQSADFTAFAQKVDQGFKGALDRASGAIDWCKQHGDLLIGTLKILGGLFLAGQALVFMSNLITAGSTMLGFIGTVGTLTKAFLLAHGGAELLAGAQSLLNAVMSANPLGLWIAAGSLVVGVLVTLYRESDKFRAFCDKHFGPAIRAIKDAFDAVKKAVGGLIDKVKEFLGMDTEKPIKVKTEYEEGEPPKPGRNALGTSYWRGGLTRVNERGGEIMNLPGGTQIIPHDLSRKAVSGGRSVNVYVTVQGNVIGNRQFAHQMGEEVAGQILDKLDNIA